jgi:hypothetical protein
MYAPIDENRMDSRMEKMPSAPAKVGKATHSTKDLVPSKPPTPEEKAKARKALGLGEATAMAKRGKDETAIRNKIASSTGGGQSADRAGALADRPTYGQSGIDPKARANYARKQMGDFRKTNSSNPGLHGYGHKSNDPDVKSKQAARGAQRGSATLTPNEKKKLNMGEAVDLFDTILEFLYVEGYAETLEEAEWLMANVIDEEAIDIIIGEGKLPLDKEKRTKIGNQIGKRLQSSGSEIIGSGSAFMPKGIRNNLRQSAAKKVGEVKKMMGALKSAQKEEYMDEAQEARNNPEKYEREQSKKYAPVRGEKTPMPPRGNKRREDFEKWYAANGPK